MTKILSSIAFTFALGLVGASGSTDNAQVTPATCINPVAPGCRIEVADNSFVRWTAPVTDGVTNGISTAIVKHSPGRFCMSGTVDSGPSGTGWGAILLVGLADVERTTGTVATPLDASALGIAQVRFSVEHPPVSGVVPQMTQLQTADCKHLPDCSAAFSEASAVFDAGTVTARLADFSQPDGNSNNTALDPTLITGLQFYVGPLPSGSLDYDFCIQDLAFLDASGQVITP